MPEAPATSQTNAVSGSSPVVRRTGLILGPAIWALLLIIGELPGLGEASTYVLGVTLWVATWWLTEAIPIPATSVLPIVLLTPTEHVDPDGVFAAYASPIVFMFLGGFIIAVAIQRWGLDLRFALLTIRTIGEGPRAMLLGFMVATAVLSAWLSNTATALMILPIALAVIRHEEQDDEDDDEVRRFGQALVLGIAYAATIGGLATLIGTPPNAILAGLSPELIDYEISFSKWMIFAMPLSITLLAAAYVLLARVAFRLPRAFSTPRGGHDHVVAKLAGLGPMTRPERLVLVVFFGTATAWAIRPAIDDLLPFLLSDAIVALTGALLLFIIPAGKAAGAGVRLMDWDHAKTIPWGVLLLLGGGLALASAFTTSGLAAEVAEALGALDGLSEPMMILLVVVASIALTEIASNTASAATLIPVVAAAAANLGMDPLQLMIAATLGSTTGFMMPVGTPPMALAYGTGRLRIATMAKVGIGLNIVSAILVTLFVWQVVPLVW